MVTWERWPLNTGLINVKFSVNGKKLRSCNTNYSLIEVVTKAGLTVICLLILSQNYHFSLSMSRICFQN